MTEAAGRTAAALVVGGGISGMAAAAACADPASSPPVVVFDRGRRVGGRMAARTVRSGPWAGHVVDLGAAYFTVSQPDFAAVVADWSDRGLVREWTDRFAVAGPTGIQGSSVGPMRYAAPAGLRSLVEDLADQAGGHVVVRHPAEATWLAPTKSGWRLAAIDTDGGANAAALGFTAPVVALCVPPPQAVELLDTPTDGDSPAAGPPGEPQSAVLDALRTAAAAYAYEPILALIAQWPQRCWDSFAGCFVNDDQVLTFIADDGDRRGDGAAVLVAHSTPGFAADHLLDPAGATAELTAALCRILGLPSPASVEVKRWGMARPTPVHSGPGGVTSDPAADGSHDTGYLLAPDGTVGIASDAFDLRPRVEAAWLSGRHLGMALRSAAGTA